MRIQRILLGYTVCALVLLLVLLLVVAGGAIVNLTGCGHASQVATAVIDCTKTDHTAQIDAIEAELKLLTSWENRYTRAVIAGSVIGGCALLRLIEHRGDTPAPSVLPDQGMLTFERFRREQAGGASFKTRGGTI